MFENVGLCALCGGLTWDLFCESCLPKVTSTGVCLLCRVSYKTSDPKFCDSCREDLGEESDADGARFMRQLQRRFSKCSKGDHWLGLIPCFCADCKELQPGWVHCRECFTVRSDNHICECGHNNFAIEPPQYISHRVIRKSDGKPIHADLDSRVWKDLRTSSVGASDAMKLIKQNGERRTSYSQLLNQKQSGEDDEEFWSFDHGIQREPLIARWVQINLPNHELVPNRFVFGGEDIRHTATPDMIGPRSLAEIKTSTKPLKQTLSRYFDQLQWQMHVTDYDSVLFVVEHRTTQEIDYTIVHRDDSRILLLVEAANDLLDEL